MASSLYKELSDKELCEFVTRVLQTDVISSRLLSGGLFNTTYLVDTVKYGKTVLRLGPINRHLLMPFEHRLMETEEYVYTLCAEHNIPTSRIIISDTSKKIIERDFMFVQYIPGHPMNETELTAKTAYVTISERRFPKCTVSPRHASDALRTLKTAAASHCGVKH